MDEFEIKMLNKIDNNEKLSEREIRELICNSIEDEYGDNNRWTRGVESIVQIGNRFFSICWDEGLTECQENEYYGQPVEVEKVTYEKTITVTEWKEIKKDESEDK